MQTLADYNSTCYSIFFKVFFQVFIGLKDNCCSYLLEYSWTMTFYQLSDFVQIKPKVIKITICIISNRIIWSSAERDVVYCLMKRFTATAQLHSWREQWSSNSQFTVVKLSLVWRRSYQEVASNENLHSGILLTGLVLIHGCETRLDRHHPLFSHFVLYVCVHVCMHACTLPGTCPTLPIWEFGLKSEGKKKCSSELRDFFHDGRRDCRSLMNW